MDALTPGLVAEIACSAPTWLDLERAVLELVMSQIGADTAFFADTTGPSEASLGRITEQRVQLARLWPELGPGMSSLQRVALAGDGVVVDNVLLGRRLERLPYYQLVMRPVRGRTTMLAFLAPRGCLQRKLAIGRCEGSPAFGERPRRLLATIVPTLTLACAAFGAERRVAAAPATLEALTAREREVYDYLHLGYTNAQIACALGTSDRTVRNQLSRVYAKLGVANRAEAVGLSRHVPHACRLPR